MEWNEELVLNFISSYRDFPVLWDPKDANYFNKHLKEDAWKMMAARLGQPIEECKKKLLSLLSSYRRERARIKKSLASGAAEVYTSRWFAFEALRFLEDKGRAYYRPRESVNTDSPSVSFKEGDEIEFNQDEEDSRPTSEPSPAPTSRPAANIQPTVTSVRSLYSNYHQSQSGKEASKRKLDEHPEEALVHKILKAVTDLPDDSQIFGDYVASEMRNLRTDHHRRVLRRMIQKAIVTVGEMDDALHPQQSYAEFPHSQQSSPTQFHDYVAAASEVYPVAPTHDNGYQKMEEGTYVLP